GIKLNKVANWYEGVCFVDVFDPSLCPNGNPKNVAMVYAAPPHGMHYPVEADFLAAIEAMAVTIIKTVAAYNAEAAKQKLPAIEVLRNTLFSSAIYNPNGVSKDKIARAIFAGMASGLNVDTGGIVDLQFPVSDDKSQSSYPGFAAVRDDLANAKKARPAHR